MHFDLAGETGGIKEGEPSSASAAYSLSVAPIPFGRRSQPLSWLWGLHSVVPAPAAGHTQAYAPGLP